MKILRLVAAGLFVFVGMMALVGTMSAAGALDWNPWWTRLAIVCAGGGLYALALYLFNPKGSDVFGRRSAEDRLRELERLDLLVDTSFTVTRAFGVEDYGGEVSHYFLELADGSGILVLSGQYLYEYEPIDDDPELNQPRRFPCTSFTVRRHRIEHYLVDLICGGDVIEPEVMASRRVVKAWIRDGFQPEDGTILTGVSFDDLKRLRAEGG